MKLKNKSMKLQPLRDNVLIAIKKEDRTEAGLYIPDSSIKERPMEGVAEAVGDEVEKVKVGDKLLFVRHGQTEIKDTNLIIISEEDILAIIV